MYCTPQKVPLSRFTEHQTSALMSIMYKMQYLFFLLVISSCKINNVYKRMSLTHSSSSCCFLFLPLSPLVSFGFPGLTVFALCHICHNSEQIVSDTLHSIDHALLSDIRRTALSDRHEGQAWRISSWPIARNLLMFSKSSFVRRSQEQRNTSFYVLAWHLRQS